MECMCTPSLVEGCNPISRRKTCPPGISHCLLSLKWLNESNKHVENIQNCWPWLHDMTGCPDTPGSCYLISESKDKFINCCCKGSLCNNATNLNIVSPPANASKRFGVSTVYPKFIQTLKDSSGVHIGIDSVEQKKEYLALIIAIPIIILLVLILFCGLFLRWPKFRASRFKQSLNPSKKRNLFSIHNNQSFGMLPDHLGCLSVCDCARSLNDNSLARSEGPNDSFDLKDISRNPVAHFCWSSNGDHPELISVIKKIELKAHGRFGQVWYGRFTPPLGSEKFNLDEIVGSETQQVDVAIKIFNSLEKRSWETELAVFNVPGLTHPNILKYYCADQVSGDEETGEDRWQYWLVTEYHELGSVYDYLHSRCLKWTELLIIAIGIARGLAHLHAELPLLSKPSIAHRDLNSRNLLLKSDMTACIADFGLAIRFERGQCMRDAHLQLGTRRYMAPEVLDGAIQFSRDAFLRIDVYALGLVFWELMMRCNGSNPDAPALENEYMAPFELELGPQPSMEMLQAWVAQAKQRPKFNPQWKSDPGLCTLWETVEECWDQDAEARLSAGCVAERLTGLYRQSLSVQTPKTIDAVITTNDYHSEIIHNQSISQLINPKSETQHTVYHQSDLSDNYDTQFQLKINHNQSTICPPTICLPVLQTNNSFSDFPKVHSSSNVVNHQYDSQLNNEKSELQNLLTGL